MMRILMVVTMTTILMVARMMMRTMLDPLVIAVKFDS